MHHTHHTPPPGWLLCSGLVLIVISFMALSLAVTATGTARFAVALGYPATIGYVVGAVFDVAKAVLPVALLMLLARRAVMSFALIGVAWLGLVTYSSLATHATVGIAIGSIERTGTWKMEGRANTKSELAAVEQRLAALADPRMPRPATTVRKALAAEKVPPAVWRRSQECLNIRRSTYFQKACAQVLKLRGELAAAEDYEKLEARAKDMREVLAAAPMVATTDPLPEAFAATLGHLLPLDGRVGVALLLMIVIEIMSCFGLAGLRALREGHRREKGEMGRQTPKGNAFESSFGRLGARAAQLIPDRSLGSIPRSSPRKSSTEAASGRVKRRAARQGRRSNIIPLAEGGGLRKSRAREAANISACLAEERRSFDGAHVRAFVRDCLQHTDGLSVGASDLRAAYEGWCAIHGKEPLSQQKLGVALRALGYAKWKSCGLIRYRDVQLVA